VKASSAVVAFISDAGRGTWLACEQALRSGKPIVLFSTNGARSICAIVCGRWKPVASWQGAWRWETSVPVGERCRHGIEVENCSSGMHKMASHGNEEH
jgi:hypothetical protein